jgi:hypothetical protein
MKTRNPSPLFLVSVVAKGLRYRVSLLFATFAGRFISVAAKGFTGAVCWQESNGLEWEDLEGVRRTARREAIDRKGRRNCPDITAAL